MSICLVCDEATSYYPSCCQATLEIPAYHLCPACKERCDRCPICRSVNYTIRNEDGFYPRSQIDRTKENKYLAVYLGIIFTTLLPLLFSIGKFSNFDCFLFLVFIYALCFDIVVFSSDGFLFCQCSQLIFFNTIFAIIISESNQNMRIYGTLILCAKLLTNFKMMSRKFSHIPDFVFYSLMYYFTIFLYLPFHIFHILFIYLWFSLDTTEERSSKILTLFIMVIHCSMMTFVLFNTHSIPLWSSILHLVNIINLIGFRYLTL